MSKINYVHIMQQNAGCMMQLILEVKDQPSIGGEKKFALCVEGFQKATGDVCCIEIGMKALNPISFCRKSKL